MLQLPHILRYPASSNLLEHTSAGFPIDVDLRVDHSADPVGELRLLLNIQDARQILVKARTATIKGETQQAEALLIEGVSLAPTWPRIWIQVARVAAMLERPDLTMQYLNVVFTMNAAWADDEIGEGRYALIGADPAFHRWISAGQKRVVHDEYERVQS